MFICGKFFDLINAITERLLYSSFESILETVKR